MILVLATGLKAKMKEKFHPLVKASKVDLPSLKHNRIFVIE